MGEEKIKELIYKYLSGELTSFEIEELFDLGESMPHLWHFILLRTSSAP